MAGEDRWWDDPYPWLERHRAAVQAGEGMQQKARDAFVQLSFLWDKVIGDTRSIDDFLALGRELHRIRFEFWLDLYSWITVRNEAGKSGPPSPLALRKICIAKLLRASCADDCQAATTELAAVRKEFGGDHSLRDPLRAIAHEVRTWSTDSSEWPETPHITRNELIAAAQDYGLKGYSKGSVSKKINKKVLTAVKERKELVRFRHRDQRQHLGILRAVVRFLGKQPESSRISETNEVSQDQDEVSKDGEDVSKDR